MHKTIVVCLLALWVICMSLPATAQDTAPVKKTDNHSIKLSQPLREGMSLEERLEAKASFLGKGVSFDTFAKELGQTLETRVVIATRKIDEEHGNNPPLLSYKLKDVRVKSALKHILSEFGLTYLLRDNTLQITTFEDATQLETRIYDFRDLMKLPSTIKKPQESVREILAIRRRFGGGPRMHIFYPTIGRDSNYEIGDLFKVIISSADPDSWDDVGGPGSISEFKGLAIISQTQEGHEKVELLLNQLHAAGGLKEKVKVYRLSKK
jgi:hypothetical protein